MSVIILDSAIVHYEVIGRGSPVIFLHSWVGSWRYWIPCMQTASAFKRSYALDLWGFGDTSKQSNRYGLEQQVRLLHQFIQEMGMRDITLVGHGLGGVVALYYSADHPDNVQRTMVISFPAGGHTLNNRLLQGNAQDLSTWLFEYNATTLPARMDALKADQRAICASLEQFQQVNWRQLIMRTCRPTLWLFGAEDPAVRPPNQEFFSFLPENSACQMLDQAGHFPMLETGRPFSRLLVSFLNLKPDQDLETVRIKEEWRRRVR